MKDQAVSAGCGSALPNSAELKFLINRIVVALPRYGYRFSNEIVFQDGIAKVLNDEQIAFQREYVAGPADRFDFFIEGGVVIEAKIKGSFSQAARQVMRYAERDDVSAVILAATRYWAAAGQNFKDTYNGKPARLLKLSSVAF